MVVVRRSGIREAVKRIKVRETEWSSLRTRSDINVETELSIKQSIIVRFFEEYGISNK